MSERLTDEQVAEALERQPIVLAGHWKCDGPLYRDDGMCSACGTRWPCAAVRDARVMLQVSADLSAAKAATRNALRIHEEEAAKWVLAVNAAHDQLSALQEKARAVIKHTEGMRLVVGVNCTDDERRAVVADACALRSLLPEEGR